MCTCTWRPLFFFGERSSSLYYRCEVNVKGASSEEVKVSFSSLLRKHCGCFLWSNFILWMRIKCQGTISHFENASGYFHVTILSYVRWCVCVYCLSLLMFLECPLHESRDVRGLLSLIVSYCLKEWVIHHRPSVTACQINEFLRTLSAREINMGFVWWGIRMMRKSRRIYCILNNCSKILLSPWKTYCKFHETQPLTCRIIT